MGIKLKDLDPKEIARFEAKRGGRDSGFVVADGTVYEILALVKGEVLTQTLEGQPGPRLPKDQVEVLDLDEKKQGPLKKEGGRWQEKKSP